MEISRRGFLSALAGGIALGAGSRSGLAEGAAAPQWTPHPGDLLPGPVFRHGVASGDPLAHRVLLWTRVTPESLAEVPVHCVVASDSRLRNVVGRYRGIARPSGDFTVKVDAHGLAPGRTYYYRFHARGEASPVGRTRTLPLEAERVRLGVASCSNWPAGFFAAYGQMARQRDLDAIIHLGDYIYEYANQTYGDGTDIGRIPEPDRETVTLADYRSRYAQYRTDHSLQEAHRLHPWIVVWDDHEIANDAYVGGAENHQAGEGPWERRKREATRAWFEWLPVRDPDGLRSRTGRLFRRFRFGRLAQLDMLDTRHFGREPQVPPLIDGVSQELLVTPEQLFAYLGEINRPDRQLLGLRQERWLYRQLEAAQQHRARWNILGQQIMMGQLSLGADNLPQGVRIPLNPDQWDGYGAARARLLGFLESHGRDNTIVLTGDFHSSWAQDITADPYNPATYDPVTGNGSQAVEFVAPGISSPFFTDPDPALVQGLEQFALLNNPHTHYVDLEHKGYLVMDIDAYRARGEWYHIDDVLNPDSGESLGAAVEVLTGTNHAVLTEGAVAASHTGSRIRT